LHDGDTNRYRYAKAVLRETRRLIKKEQVGALRIIEPSADVADGALTTIARKFLIVL